jgi:hypothetical protein
MVAYLKFRSATALSCQQILRLFEINLFLCRDFLDLPRPAARQAA